MLLAATVLASGPGILTATAADQKPAALIIAQGGLGDQSYNDLAYSGFQKALKETGIDGKPVGPAIAEQP